MVQITNTLTQLGYKIIILYVSTVCFTVSCQVSIFNKYKSRWALQHSLEEESK